MPRSVWDTVGDPDFLALPADRRRAILEEFHPDFLLRTPEGQIGVLAEKIPGFAQIEPRRQVDLWADLTGMNVVRAGLPAGVTDDVAAGERRRSEGLPSPAAQADDLEAARERRLAELRGEPWSARRVSNALDVAAGGAARAGQKVLGAGEAVTDLAESAWSGAPATRGPAGRAADFLGRFAAERSPEVRPELDMGALDDALSYGVQGAAMLPVIAAGTAAGGPAGLGLYPAIEAGSAYDATGDPAEAVKAGGYAAALQALGLVAGLPRSLPARLAAGAVLDAGLAQVQGLDAGQTLAQVITGMPFNVNQTRAPRAPEPRRLGARMNPDGSIGLFPMPDDPIAAARGAEAGQRAYREVAADEAADATGASPVREADLAAQLGRNPFSAAHEPAVPATVRAAEQAQRAEPRGPQTVTMYGGLGPLQALFEPRRAAAKDEGGAAPRDDGFGLSEDAARSLDAGSHVSFRAADGFRPARVVSVTEDGRSLLVEHEVGGKPQISSIPASDVRALPGNLEPYRQTINDAIGRAQSGGKMPPVASSADEVARLYHTAMREQEALPPTDIISTPARERKREDVSDLLHYRGGKAEGPAFMPDRGLRADLVLGLPAAGKSKAMIEPLIEAHRSLLIDADEAKKLFDEYQDGRGASQVHKESADVVEKRLLPRAIANGENLAIAMVGKNPVKIEDLLGELKAKGYETNLHFVDLPIEKAKQRILSRFVEEHRAVSIDYVDRVGPDARSTFDALKHRRDIVDGWQEVSNDVPFRSPPRYVDGRGKDGGPYDDGTGRFRGQPVSDRGVRGGVPPEARDSRAGGRGGAPPRARPPGSPPPEGGVGGTPPPEEPEAPPGRRTPEGWPGRGFGVRVSDREPKFAHSARILGDDAEAFVRSFLEDPVQGPRLEARRRGVLGAARVDELAARVGLSASDYLRMAQGSIFPAEVQAHLASLIHAHREALADVTAHREQALREGNAAGVAAAEASVGQLSHNMARLLMTLEASRSEAGRTLGANRLAKTKAEGLAMKALRMVMDETTLPEPVRSRLAARIAAAGGDSVAVINAVREAYLPGWWQRLIELRVNLLLSSPVTILRNTVGNSLAVATRLTEQLVGLPIDLAYEYGYRATHGGRAAPQAQNRRTATEIAYDLFGTIHSSIEGFRLAARALADESFAAAHGRVGEEALLLPAIRGRKGEAIRVPSRFQSAADLFFYHMNATGRRYQLAARQARHEGAEGPALYARISELVREAEAVDERVVQRIAGGQITARSEAERIAASAHQYGEEFTFRSRLGNFARAIDRARNVEDPFGYGAKLLIPFYRTPVDVAKFGAQRSVLGFISPRNRNDILRSGNRDQIVSAAARMTLGAASAYVLTNLALSGYISGSGPKERAAREAMERTGWLRYAVRIGDTWYSYRGYSPLTEQMGLAAEMAENIQRRKDGGGLDLETLQRVGLSIAQTSVDQPMWTNVSDLIDAIRKSDNPAYSRKATSAGVNLVASMLVPRGSAFAAKATDPVSRAFAEDDLETALKQSVPGLRQQTLPWRDALGRGYETADAALQAVIPHRRARPQTPLDQWLWDIRESVDKAVVGYPERTQLGRRLSPEDYDRLLMARGELLLPALERMRQAMQGAPVKAAQAAVAGLLSKVTHAAEARVVPDAELRALGLEPTEQARRTMLSLMDDSHLRPFYEMAGRTDGEKRQILGLVQRAPSDPRAMQALQQMVLAGGREREGAAAAGAP